jgi:hypothetical protein
VRVKVTGDAAGGGKYTGAILTDSTATPDESGNLTDDDIGTIPETDDALIYNMAEIGVSTHDLTTGTPKQTIFIGYSDGRETADGMLLVVINGFDWENCT